MTCSLCGAPVVRGRMEGPGASRLVVLDAAPTRAGALVFDAPVGHDRVIVRRLGGETLRATRQHPGRLYSDHGLTCPYGAIPAGVAA